MAPLLNPSRPEDFVRHLKDICLTMAALSLATALALAQATWQPTPPRRRGRLKVKRGIAAANLFRGATRIDDQAGAAVFFNRYQMVRSGSGPRHRALHRQHTGRRGDSVLHVPVAGGLMQRYERRRTGALAGTTGNRAPSFPVGIAAEGITERSGRSQRPSRFQRSRSLEVSKPVPTAGRSIVEAPSSPRQERSSRPKGINGVWITYDGRRWFATGKAVRLDWDFKRTGDVSWVPDLPAGPERRLHLSANGRGNGRALHVAAADAGERR